MPLKIEYSRTHLKSQYLCIIVTGAVLGKIPLLNNYFWEINVKRDIKIYDYVKFYINTKLVNVKVNIFVLNSEQIDITQNIPNFMRINPYKMSREKQISIIYK